MKIVNEKLNEASTSRTYNHIVKDDNFAIISPYRTENSDAQNRSNMNSLKQEVRKLGYGFNELIARWVEYDENAEKNVASDERSLFIHGITKDQAMKLGKKYNQSSIIVKDESGCYEVCTTPFSYEDNGKIIEYNVGDTVRPYNITGDKVLNIEDAKEIFSGRVDGPSSKPVKGTRPFKFTTNENTKLEVYSVESPRASYFHNSKDERLTRIF